MQTLMKIAVLGCVACIFQGCSTFAATSGPERKNFSVLELGTPRYAVLAEFGQPFISDKDNDSHKFDVFKFRQGTHGAFKATKAIGYGAAAVMTLGLSELITNPVERTINKGAEMQLKVGYTSDGLVDEVVVLKDGRWLPFQDVTEEDRAKTQANKDQAGELAQRTANENN